MLDSAASIVGGVELVELLGRNPSHFLRFAEVDVALRAPQQSKPQVGGDLHTARLQSDEFGFSRGPDAVKGGISLDGLRSMNQGGLRLAYAAVEPRDGAVIGRAARACSMSARAAGLTGAPLRQARASLPYRRGWMISTE
jgi:hypothetical protein